ncbi:hypothetical protein K438DRAFT_1605216, partial [Mycena galopus ATCC 62051]
LVLVRHTKPENTVSGEVGGGYWGPLVVIRRSTGGYYVVAEMNGAVFQEKIAAFRVIPYEARHSIQLPAKLQKFVDVSKEALKALVDGPEPPPFLLKKTRKYKGKDLLFDKVRLRTTPEDFEEPETSESETESETEEPFGLDPEPENQGPRRSNRKQKA